MSSAWEEFLKGVFVLGCLVVIVFGGKGCAESDAKNFRFKTCIDARVDLDKCLEALK